MDSRKLYAAGPDWYRHVRPGSFNITKPPKLLFKGIDRFPKVGRLAEHTNFNGANCPGIILQDTAYRKSYVLGILNSRLIASYLNSVCPPKLNNTFRYNGNNLNMIPVAGVTDRDLDSQGKYSVIP